MYVFKVIHDPMRFTSYRVRTHLCCATQPGIVQTGTMSVHIALTIANAAEYCTDNKTVNNFHNVNFKYADRKNGKQEVGRIPKLRRNVKNSNRGIP